MLHFTLKLCYPDSLKTASPFYRLDFIPAGRCNCSHGKVGPRFLATNCSECIDKDEWPPNSPDLNPLDYHVWGDMLERYKTFHPKPKNIEELKNVLQVIWDQLPQVSINK